MKYYIAYGSNLNIQQMKHRCPGAEVVGMAELKDWRLLFRGSRTGSYLTIKRAKGYIVPVAVWSVTEADEKALDRYEGYPSFYYKRGFILPCSDGKRHRVFAYIMPKNRPIGLPSEHYMAICAEGYRDFDFDLEILFQAWEESNDKISRGKVS